VAGEKISRTLNVPLVLDYRDPWTTVFSGLPREAGLLARWMNPALERRIVSRASAIVSVHKSVPALMEAGLGIRGLAARCDWIPNGYDPEDFENVTANPSEDFTLTYVGSLYGGRSLRPVAEALGKLVRSGQLDGSRIRFKVLGPDRTLVMKDFAGTPFGDCVDAPGFVSHRDALSALVSSTVNVLVDIAYDGPNVHTPGKLYEYLRAGRPILSVSPEGATREVIDEARAGWVVSPGDRAGLLQVLKKAHDDWRAGRALPAADPGVTNLYDRARLAAELADILRACVRDKVGRQTL
jgi:glycosyltransferase involved in cell wall biosynthesis